MMLLEEKYRDPKPKRPKASKHGNRAKIRAVAFALAVPVVLGGFLVKSNAETQVLRRQEEATLAHTFSEFCTKVQALRVSLQKAEAVQSPPMLCALFGAAARDAAAAQSLLARFPTAEDQTAAFLAKAGDWSLAMARTAADGGALGAQERTTLTELSKSLGSLQSNLAALETAAIQNNVRYADVFDVQTEAGTLFADTFSASAKELSSLPSLIYDGPFSDHLAEQTAAMTQNAPDISAEEGLNLARDFFGMPGLTFAREGVGALPTYVYEGYHDGGEVSVEVTRAGGHMLSLLGARETEQRSVSADEAAYIAAEFLQTAGFRQMEENYRMDNGSYLLVNFVYTQDGVTVYPDMIKVGVALDTGKVVSYDARGYIQSHQETRDFGVLPPTNEKRCVIATPGGKEILCTETRKENPGGETVLIYTDCATGKEVNALVLLENELGTLTI